VSTCPSPDPIDANIERKLHDAEAALLHTNHAVTRGTKKVASKISCFVKLPRVLYGAQRL
jgi:hypothetical protein